ncbi:osmotic avoidance abnormal protein 3-like [Ischnura elegans]|uniref:osmotic avoidance abnormal protein 3-like n=1 Tax=Ischnura elegans TaxID=197161 RepID=UPI001ED8A2CD|nr:osmotic avoidance abnormal protein 3-like [Ischnura elegans]
MPKSGGSEDDRGTARGAAEAVKVVVRCRPLSDAEKKFDPKSIIHVESCGCAVTISNPKEPSSPPKCFTFDAAYPPSTQTCQIYNEMAYPLVEGVLDGYNGTIFAYGQTGSGKTYTMQGGAMGSTKSFEVLEECIDVDQVVDDFALGESLHRGIIPRAFEHVFESASVRKCRYLVVASFLEIYNEDIRDLLAPFVSSSASSFMSSSSPPSTPVTKAAGKIGTPQKVLPLRENAEKGVYVEGLSRHPVHSPADCHDLLLKGLSYRASGATLMNAESSRSHSLFTLSLEMITSDALVDDGFCSGEEDHIMRGKLNLVDLAGSERQVKTGASGERFREATKINLSLSALGNVISALVDGKSKHVPYRDSKLTRLLQDSLGGNTRTLMIACVSGASSSYTESLSTLRYAYRAKQIENTPKKNEDPKDALLRQFKQELDMLRRALRENGQSPSAVMGLNEDQEGDRSVAQQNLEEETKKLIDSKEKLEADIEELRRQYEQEKLGRRAEGEIDILSLNSGGTDSASSKENETSPVNDNQWPGGYQSIMAASPVPEAVLYRLVKVQASLVGGERVNDEVLKEKRRKKRSQVEKRLQALASAVEMVHRRELEEEEESNASDHRSVGGPENNYRAEGKKVLMKAFGDVRDELISKSDALKKVKNRVKALQVEIRDLQSEFECERTDYLETIRRQNQQLKLHQQIMDKLIPALKYECNYSDMERIKQEAIWSEDSQRWRLPEMVPMRIRFPPAQPTSVNQSSNQLESIKTGSTIDVEGIGEEDEDMSSVLKLKLERSEAEDFAGNYMRPKRAAELLNRAKEETSKNVARWKSYSSHGSTTQTEIGLYRRPTGVFFHNSVTGSGGIGSNSTWSGSINSAWAAFNPSNTGLTKPAGNYSINPTRLDALPVLDKKMIRKKGKTELNALEFA